MAERPGTHSRAPRTGARPRAAARRAPAEDLVALYHRSAGYGPVLRTILATGLVVLAASTAWRLAGGAPPPTFGLSGTLLLLCFLAMSMVGHYRGLYRVRRDHPGAWQTGNVYSLGILLAPFGVGIPSPTRYDRAVRAVIAAGAVALLVLLVAASVTHR